MLLQQIIRGVLHKIKTQSGAYKIRHGRQCLFKKVNEKKSIKKRKKKINVSVK